MSIIKKVIIILLLIQQLCLKCYTYALLTCEIDKDNNNEIIYRLPNNTFPLYYEININTALEKNNFQFNGTTIIKIMIKEDKSNQISLHSKSAKIENIEIKDVNEKSIQINKCIINIKTDILTITTNETLIKNNQYFLTIKYTSYLRDDNLGFYKSSYIDENGNKM